MRSDTTWSLPISPVAAIIYESIHSGALCLWGRRVDSWRLEVHLHAGAPARGGVDRSAESRAAAGRWRARPAGAGSDRESTVSRSLLFT
eukprot:COSAG02_NODE_2155_length_9651_cov_112.913544_1_plen_89_part_00